LAFLTLTMSWGQVILTKLNETYYRNFVYRILFRYDIHRMPCVNYRNPWIELGNYLPLKPDLQHTANRKQLQQIEFLRQFQTVKDC